MFDVVGAFKGIFDAVAALLGFAKQQSELHNTPEMKEREEAQKEAANNDKIETAIKDKNEDDIRKVLSD